MGVICHGPWTLIDAGVAKGRTLTSYPSLRIDLQNAGATAGVTKPFAPFGHEMADAA